MKEVEVEVKVDLNLKRLLKQEDLDKDQKITIDDKGPGHFLLEALDGSTYAVSGVYYLSNLLQALAYAHQEKKETCIIKTREIFQNPLDHISTQIRERYWDALKRELDERGLVRLLEDPKAAKQRRLYIPKSDPKAIEYFKGVSERHGYLHLEIVELDKDLSIEDHQALDKKPGLLALALKEEGGAYPFVVPGGRFNEMYGWDSYFIMLGLIEDKRFDLAFGLLENAMYQIEHYGSILNANRSYYLSRSQPPLFTAMILELARALPEEEVQDWIERPTHLAIQMYERVWMSPDHLTESGLSRYYGGDLKEPIEVEPGHFDEIYEKRARAKNMDLGAYREAYKLGELEDRVLDEYFVHDRAMRESGHDTTNRLVGTCADLNTVDLNSLLYKMEKDIEVLIHRFFDGTFLDKGEEVHTSEKWAARAEKRQKRMLELMWDADTGLFYDYNVKLKKRCSFESATTFYPLFANLVPQDIAEQLITKALPLFEEPGGIVSTTKKSRGAVSDQRMQRQWDYPFGWAPHQMLFWKGACDYGYKQVARRVAYRWLYMVTKEAMDYNGVLAEKYDVVHRTHKKSAEYGNVGVDFGLYPDGGFGWVNSSFQVGRALLSEEQRAALKDLSPPEWIFKGRTEPPK